MPKGARFVSVVRGLAVLIGTDIASKAATAYRGAISPRGRNRMATKKTRKPGTQLKHGKKLTATKPLTYFPPNPCGKI
jgi:hypothetical protein